MSDPDLYTIGEVASILGVSAHTIRAWERRHGVVHPLRNRAKQRRYRGQDIELLREVKRSIDLNGLSLRVAFQVVSGGQHPMESRAPKVRTSRSELSPKPPDAGIWNAVADALPQVIMTIDPEGQILEANLGAAKVFGTMRQRLAGRHFSELVDPFDRAKAVLLYRPQPRTVKGWELNLLTEHGSRLYSFQSWQVREDGHKSLALVGSEMFATEPNPMAGVNLFEALVDQVPFGVVVTTIGPQPTVLFANGRLPELLRIGPGEFTGRRLTELLPDEAAGRTLQEVVVTRAARSVKDPRTHLDLNFRPLFSSSGRVASVLVVVQEATTDAA